MSARTILILGLVAAALLGYVLVFERGSVTSKELSDRAGRVLPSFVRDKVERITVQRKGKEVVLARRKENDGLGDLTLVAPLKASADTDASDRLLGELEWLSARRTLDATPEDRKRFGVDAPRFRVSYVAGGETHVLAVGHDDVHGEGLYVRVDDEPTLHVVPKTLLEVIDHEPGYFRDKSLYPELTVAWATRLKVEGREPSAEGTPRVHTFSKEAKHWWLGEASAKLYADDKRVDEILHAFSDLRASREVEPNERAQAEAGLEKVTLSLATTLAPDETREDKQVKSYTLEVGGPCGAHAGERFARASVLGPQAEPRASAAGADARLVCVREDDLKAFALGELALAEPRLVRALPSDVERFVIARRVEARATAGEPRMDELAWKRDGTGWKSAVDAPADAKAIEGWLEDLGAARVLRQQPLGSFEPRGKLRLELVGDRSEEIAYGALAADGTLPVHRGDEALLVSFPASVFDRLAPVRTRFAPLKVWGTHQPSEVVRFDAQASGKQRSGELTDGNWRVQGEGSAERVRELVRSLVGLEAVAFVTDQARAEHGLGKGQLELGLRDGGKLSLELGGSTDRGSFARIGGSIYELSSGVVAQIVELAGGPAAPPSAHEDDEDGEIHGHDDEGEHAH